MREHPERGMKLAAVAMAVIGALVAFVLVPVAARAMLWEYPERGAWYWPGMIYAWAVLAPGFCGLWEFWKICVRIGQNDSFSRGNAQSLFRICGLALGMAALLVAGAAALCILRMGQPGLLLLMLGGAAACAIVALLACALGQLVRRAAVLQSESELTI